MLVSLQINAELSVQAQVSFVENQVLAEINSMVEKAVALVVLHGQVHKSLLGIDLHFTEVECPGDSLDCVNGVMPHIDELVHHKDME